MERTDGHPAQECRIDTILQIIDPDEDRPYEGPRTRDMTPGERILRHHRLYGYVEWT